MENSPKSIRCKAAVCRAPGEPLVIEEVEVAPPKAFEVRIKIICTSLCHSDLTFWRRQDFSIFLPRILGHEAFGLIESLGDGVKGMEVGDAVVPTFLSNCGECRECRSEKGNFCSVAPFSVFPGMPRDGTVRFTDAAGRPVNNFLGVSSFCEYTVVDIAQVTKVDSALPPEKACLLSCGVSTAAVCRAPGEPLVIEEVEVAPPKAFEVRIKIICTSLCHSDLTFWRKQDFSIFLPCIFGHEAFGLIESLGDGVKGMEVGDAVVPTFLANCGECRECRSEKGNFCAGVPFSMLPGMPRDGTVRFTDAAGRPVNNFLGVSSFCEYTVVDIAQVTKVDSALPPEKACLLSCGVSTGVGAVRKVAAVEAGSSVVIFGLGAVGLAVVEGARFQGAAKIIGVDVNPEKFDIGKNLGLTHFVNPKDIGEKSVVEIIKEITDGGADYCFECIGLASLMSDAFNCSRVGVGKTIILGVEMHGNPLSIDSAEILKGKCIMGSLFGGIKAKIDIPILAKQYLNKELHLDEFITHEVDFMDINKAFDLLVQGKSLRCIIWMNQ